TSRSRRIRARSTRKRWFTSSCSDRGLTRLPSASSDSPLVLQLEDVSGVEIKGGSRPCVRAAELRVAAIADGDVLEPAVDDEIDERGGTENAVRDEILAEPVKDGADQCADNDHGEADLRIEVFPRVEVAAGAYGTAIDRPIAAYGVGHRQRNHAPAAAALDGRRCVDGADRKSGVAFRTLRHDLHRLIVPRARHSSWSAPMGLKRDARHAGR